MSLNTNRPKVALLGLILESIDLRDQHSERTFYL